MTISKTDARKSTRIMYGCFFDAADADVKQISRQVRLLGLAIAEPIIKEHGGKFPKPKHPFMPNYRCPQGRQKTIDIIVEDLKKRAMTTKKPNSTVNTEEFDFLI